jgi:hypothetical protein
MNPLRLHDDIDIIYINIDRHYMCMIIVGISIAIDLELYVGVD